MSTFNRFALPAPDPETLELVCENPDCPGRKADTVRVRFLARIARVDFDEDDGQEVTLEDSTCPWCGREGERA